MNTYFWQAVPLFQVNDLKQKMSSPTTPIVSTTTVPVVSTPAVPVVSTTTVPVVSTPAVPVVSTSTMPVVGSASTPTLVRVKRRLTEEPNDVLVLSAKRLKSCDAGTRYRTSTSIWFINVSRTVDPDPYSLAFPDPDLYLFKERLIWI